MTDTEVAWLAGLLEGEACFSLSNNGPKSRARWPNVRPTLLISLSMVDQDVVERAALLMGGNGPTKQRRAHDHWQDQWRTSVSAAKAEAVLQLVYPYLGERRRERVDELFALDLSHRPRKAK